MLKFVQKVLKFSHPFKKLPAGCANLGNTYSLHGTEIRKFAQKFAQKFEFLLDYPKEISIFILAVYIGNFCCC